MTETMSNDMTAAYGRWSIVKILPDFKVLLELLVTRLRVAIPYKIIEV